MSSSFNIFECGRKFLVRLDLSYERACMVTAREEYYTKMLKSLLDNNDCHGTPFSSKFFQEAVSRVVSEREEKGKYVVCNVNKVTMYDFSWSPLRSTQRKYSSMTNERRIALDIHAETIK